MKKNSWQHKRQSDKQPAAGPQGISIAPPAYGLGSIDLALPKGRRDDAAEPTPEPGASIQMKAAPSVVNGDPAWGPQNHTGLPDALKAGVESLSGLSLDDVRVHTNSSKPAALQALAYTQGTDIHVGPGQERHPSTGSGRRLPHEAWHIVQQKHIVPASLREARVRATGQMAGQPVNDNAGLEQEAEQMGSLALKTMPGRAPGSQPGRAGVVEGVVQMAKRDKKMVPPKLVRKTNFIPWAWTDNLKMTWGDWEVQSNPVHTGDVTNNQLYGGYTILYGNGIYRQRSNYGPYTPGSSKENHVERKFWRAMESSLETDIAADDTEDEDALVVIDINQHHTPCSGAKGCTRFLNSKVQELSAWDSVTGVGRFKSYDRYDSSLSETHPGRSKKTEVKDMDIEDEINLDELMGKNKSMVFHSYTEQDRFNY